MTQDFFTQQRNFQRGILDPTLNIPVRGHLDIYQNAYRARLSETLRDNFPTLHLALGDEAFDTLANEYIQIHPSTHRSIRWFGDRLEEFMRARSDTVPHPALIDIAKMEWAMRDVFDAADSAYLNFADFQSLSPDSYADLRFHFIPALRICALEWEVEPIWHALNKDPDAPTAAPRPLDHTLLIWRKDLQTLWRSLDVQEHLAINSCMTGVSFGELCAQLSQSQAEGEAATQAAVFLQQWVSDGLLAGFDLG